MESFRHPDLHQSPEVLRVEVSKSECAVIEVGQHDDGRWMWATKLQTTTAGHGYACGAKWKHFAATRSEAISSAIDEIASMSYITPRIRDWLKSLQPPQGSLFA